MRTFEINIAISEDGIKPAKNVFYQEYFDEFGTKTREVIRVVNDYSPDKPFRLKEPVLTIETLNGFTTDARAMADQTGASLNWELLKLLNKWIDNNL
jgi:hypothetical protein